MLLNLLRFYSESFSASFCSPGTAKHKRLGIHYPFLSPPEKWNLFANLQAFKHRQMERRTSAPYKCIINFCSLGSSFGFAHSKSDRESFCLLAQSQTRFALLDDWIWQIRHWLEEASENLITLCPCKEDNLLIKKTQMLSRKSWAFVISNVRVERNKSLESFKWFSVLLKLKTIFEVIIDWEWVTRTGTSGK